MEKAGSSELTHFSEKCASYLELHRRRFLQGLEQGQGARDLSQHFGGAIRGVLSSIANMVLPPEDPRASQLCFVVVGGLGRGRVAPHSDLDLLFLCSGEGGGSPAHEELFQSVLYPLWDAGVRVGHSVHTADELCQLAREDVVTATMLWDLYPMGWNRELVAPIERFRSTWVVRHCPTMLSALQESVRDRHRRYGSTPFLLEPDVKYGPGGVRDADTTGFRWADSDPRSLVRNGALLRREWQEYERSVDFLWRVRSWLHLRAGRAHDRLTFADQEEVAVLCGFEDQGQELGVERFMRNYYGAATVVDRTCQRLMERAELQPKRWRVPARSLSPELKKFGDQLVFAAPPTEVLGLETVLAYLEGLLRWGLQFHPHSKDRIAREVPGLAIEVGRGGAPEHLAELGRTFLRLIGSTRSIGPRGRSMVAELHSLGLIQVFVGEFEKLMGRVRYDAFHLYTADVQAVRAVEFLLSLRRGDALKQFDVASRCAAEVVNLAPVVLAALLHDISPSLFRRGVEEKRGNIAHRIAVRLGMDERSAAHTQWLVARRGSLLRTSGMRDVHDPEVVQEVADFAQTRRKLHDLFLLDLAIAMATNPADVTAWKLQLYNGLYQRALQELTSRGAIAGVSDGAREKLLSWLNSGDPGLPENLPQLAQEVVPSLPDRYFVGRSFEEMKAHMALVGAPGHGKPLLHWDASNEVGTLAVVAEDRPGLLSRFATGMALEGIDVVGAEIYSFDWDGRSGVLDLFQIAKPDAGWVLEDRWMDRLAVRLHRLMEDEEYWRDAVDQLGNAGDRWARRPVTSSEAEVTVDGSSSSQFTILELAAADRRGLLAMATRVLFDHGFSIHLARVNTEGDRAVEIFYLQEDQASEGPRKGSRRESGPEGMAALREELLKVCREELPTVHSEIPSRPRRIRN